MRNLHKKKKKFEKIFSKMNDDAPYIESGERPERYQALAAEYNRYYQGHLLTDGPNIALFLRSGNWWNMFGLKDDSGGISKLT